IPGKIFSADGRFRQRRHENPRVKASAQRDPVLRRSPALARQLQSYLTRASVPQSNYALAEAEARLRFLRALRDERSPSNNLRRSVRAAIRAHHVHVPHAGGRQTRGAETGGAGGTGANTVYAPTFTHPGALVARTGR